jgi:competence protein ComEC
MSERAVAALAVAAWVGALVAVPVPVVVAAVPVALALATRRPWLLCVGVLLLAGGLATAARAGLDGLPAGPVDAEMTLLTDPERFDDEVRVEVRHGRRRLEAWATGPTGQAIADRQAGDRMVLRGGVEPFVSLGSRQLSRHLAGRLDVTAASDWRPGGIAARLANGYRDLLTDGATDLDDGQRSLLAGLVLGDDRAQSPGQVDAFRGAGLTHLLAVSGQNVAFVLLVVEPLLRRLPAAGRVGLVLAVLGLFGVITRFEPSVLRAVAMAGVAVLSTAVGHPARGLRALALAVTALLLIDPLLTHSIGFRLSVAASVGIVIGAGAIADRLPGPAWLTRPVGVVAAAQLSVAPFLVAAFGPLPVAALPANLVAGPAAGPVMVWGMTAGAVAGPAPAGVARVIHLPTQLLLGWIELVARIGAASPLGGLSAPSLGAVVGGLLWWWLVPRSAERLGLVAVSAGLVGPVLAAVMAPVPIRQPVGGATVWRSGGDAVLVVHEAPRDVDLLADLRRARVRGLDLIAGEVPLPDRTVATLRERFGPVPIMAGEGPPPRVPVGPAGSAVRVGHLRVLVRVGGSRPVLDVEPDRVRGTAPAGGPAEVGGPLAAAGLLGAGAADVRSPGALGARAPPLRRDPPCAGHGHPQPDPRLVLRPGPLLGVR